LAPGTHLLPGNQPEKTEYWEYYIERVPDLPPLFNVKRHWFENILFLPINGAVCKDWFAFRPSQNLYWTRDPAPLGERALGDPLCAAGQQVTFSLFGGDTLAAFVESALCDPKDGLDQHWERQVKRLKDAFALSRSAAQDQKDANWQIITDRLSAEVHDR
jgi:hypothetical protein